MAALIAELAAVAEKETGLQLDEGLEERLCAYARSVASYPTAVKEVGLCLYYLVVSTRVQLCFSGYTRSE